MNAKTSGQSELWNTGLRQALLVSTSLVCLVGVGFLRTDAFGAQNKNVPKLTQQVAITENDRILHVLNRLGFGPRPEDVLRIKRMGINSYIESQLYPDKIDDSKVDQALQSFVELQMSDTEIQSKYKDFITMDQSAARLRRQLRKATAEKEGSASPPGTAAAGQVNAQLDRKAVAAMMVDDPDLRMKVQSTRMDLAKMATPIGLLHEQFLAAKLIRAVDSQRQLQEVLVDFWNNHFNIDIRKAPCGVLKVIDDRDVIRPHIFGKFRDLLEASAKSPAMLVYLDNFQSVADQTNPNPVRRARLRPAAAIQRKKVGLNENYAREIMELHTLGVDGGYTQQDVREVARCLTGWSIGSPDGKQTRINRYSEAGQFHFYPGVHDSGEKKVLGQVIPAGGGMEDGEKVLDILANHPATMRHISFQLCQRLVSDEPPASLLNKCVKTWKESDGNLREVVRTIVTSPEFFSSTAMRKKIKSPFEFAVSSVRALDGTLDPSALVSTKQLAQKANKLVRPPQGGGYLDMDTNSFLGQIATMGQPLFQYQAPTGFPEDSRKWVSSGALISRLNFSLALTSGRLRDVVIPNLSESAQMGSDSGSTLDKLASRILHGQISPSTRSTLLREAAQSDMSSKARDSSSATMSALLLGSPEFQRR